MPSINKNKIGLKITCIKYGSADFFEYLFKSIFSLKSLSLIKLLRYLSILIPKKRQIIPNEINIIYLAFGTPFNKDGGIILNFKRINTTTARIIPTKPKTSPTTVSSALF